MAAQCGFPGCECLNRLCDCWNSPTCSNKQHLECFFRFQGEGFTPDEGSPQKLDDEFKGYPRSRNLRRAATRVPAWAQPWPPRCGWSRPRRIRPGRTHPCSWLRPPAARFTCPRAGPSGSSRRHSRGRHRRRSSLITRAASPRCRTKRSRKLSGPHASAPGSGTANLDCRHSGWAEPPGSRRSGQERRKFRQQEDGARRPGESTCARPPRKGPLGRPKC